MARILIIDNDVMLRNMYRIKLTKGGHEVFEAENGHEAHDILTLANPDLIILDLMLPVKDGFVFLKEVNAKKKWHHIPVLILTTLAQEEDRERGHRLGAVDYLIKHDVMPSDLLKRVDSLLKEFPPKKA